MTPEQLETLATAVMGWEKIKIIADVYGRQGLYYCERNQTPIAPVMLVKDFQPHTDPKQALPLLDAFNAINQRKESDLYLEVKNEEVNHWEFTKTNVTVLSEEIIATSTTQNLASEICRTVLEWLKT